METLKFLLKSKQADLESPREVVRDAIAWMHTQFHNADLAYQYSDGGSGLGAYGYFQFQSLIKETAITLHIKVAEINCIPYAFAEVRVREHQDTILFPFFGEIGSAEGKLTILHYIADFILSTTPDLSAL